MDCLLFEGAGPEAGKRITTRPWGWGIIYRKNSTARHGVMYITGRRVCHPWGCMIVQEIWPFSAKTVRLRTGYTELLL
jgi:hypothetical protein